MWTSMALATRQTSNGCTAAAAATAAVQNERRARRRPEIERKRRVNFSTIPALLLLGDVM
jgi:hypothetical protein